MKTIASITIIAAAILFASDPAFARGPGRGHGGQGHKNNPVCKAKRMEKKAAILKKYDANNDGQLDPEERAEHREDKRQATMKKYDRNRNGRLDKQERAKVRADKVNQHLAEIDGDKNGQISKDEAANACGPLRRHFDRVDADSNGFVTKSEALAALDKVRAMRWQRKMQRRGFGPGGRRRGGFGPGGPGNLDFE